MRNISVEDYKNRVIHTQLEFDAVGLTGFKKLSMVVTVTGLYYYEVRYRLPNGKSEEPHEDREFLSLNDACIFYNSLGV